MSVEEAKITEEKGEELTLQLLKTFKNERKSYQNERKVTLLFTPNDVFVTDIVDKVRLASIIKFIM